MSDRLRHRFFVSVAFLIALFGLTPFASAGRQKRVARPVSPAAPTYDAAREVTIRGTVDDVKESLLASWRTAAQRIVVATADGPVTVELAPSSFLKARDFACARGERVELVGSRVVDGGGTVILARELRKNGAVLLLRDEAGRPAWRQQLREVRFLPAGID